MLANQPLFSIVTPCHNSAKCIHDCIKSVLRQDYPNVEHIIQDGASTDGTREIIEHYARKYPPKIRFVSEPDKGQSDGLNRAIKRSTGDLLLVLNSDDILLPHACSWAVKNMSRYPNAAAIYGDQYIINDHGKIIREYRPDEYGFKKLLCLELVPPAQAAFIRRKAVEQVGLYADETLDTCPDFEMWVRIGLRFSIQYIPGFVSKYRYSPQNTLDSGRPKTAQRFHDAKKLVLERVFNSPRTPVEIRRLRGRAYGGLLLWTAAAHYLLTGKFLDAFVKFYLPGLWVLVKSREFSFLGKEVYKNTKHFIQHTTTRNG